MIRQALRLLSTLTLMGTLSALMQSAYGGAQDVKVSLALNKASFLFDDGASPDPIQAIITIENTGTDDVITSGPDHVITATGFSDQPFQLLLLITDPNGRVIIAEEPKATVLPEPPPPLRCRDATGQPRSCEPAEILNGTASGSAYLLEVDIPDLRSHFSFPPLTGVYMVKLVIPFRTYTELFDVVRGIPFVLLASVDYTGVLESNSVNMALVGDLDGDGFDFPGPDCDDSDPDVNPGAAEVPGNGIDDDCDPATADVVAMVPGTIAIEAETQGSSKAPVGGMAVRAFDKLSSCVQSLGVAPKNFRSIWLSCVAAALGETDSAGATSLEVEPGTYLVIGEYPPGSPFGDPANTYPGKNVGEVESGQVKTARVKVKE